MKRTRRPRGDLLGELDSSFIARDAPSSSTEEPKPHRQLVLWQRGMELVESVYRVTRRFPSGEQFGLASQMRRAAVSVPANVAEGAARRSRNEYRQFLYVARGSISELDTLLEISNRLGYVDTADRHEVLALLDGLSKMSNGMLRYLGGRNAK